GNAGRSAAGWLERGGARCDPGRRRAAQRLAARASRGENRNGLRDGARIGAVCGSNEPSAVPRVSLGVSMNGFWFTEEQQAIRDGVLKLCARFDAEYWRKTDETGRFPEEFVAAMCEAGWLGAAMPTELGGSGLGVTEAA